MTTNDYSSSDQVELRPGMTVKSRDDEKLGKIVRLDADQLLVEKGFFFPNDYWVPASVVDSADDDTVYLSVDKDQVLAQNWSDGSGAWDADAQRAAAGYGIDRPATAEGAMAAADYGAATASTDVSATRAYDSANTLGTDRAATGMPTSDSTTIPVYEEELTATKRPVDAGSVTIGKDVITEERTIDVPITEERVRVSRRAVNRDATGEDAFSGGTIDVPVQTEAVDTQKRLRVAEEIDVSKEAVAKTKSVTDTVRREVADVEDNTKTNQVDDAAGSGMSNR